MRVIAGSAGGIRLDVPKLRVRPTMDRVKAAIFSSLGELVIGADVLDLFAGAGGLGIEALSRGAASALFVDEDRPATLAIQKNLARTKLTGRVRLQEVFEFLDGHTATARFDLIFADPPYDKMKSGDAYTDKLLTDVHLPKLLRPGGVFVLEKRPDEKLSTFERWTVTRARTYGATEVLFFSPVAVVT
jgi:16S rRNA (guanine966-N2)-methyltransferase